MWILGYWSPFAGKSVIAWRVRFPIEICCRIHSASTMLRNMTFQGVTPCEAAATSRAMEGFLVGMAPDVPCKMLLAPKHGATEGADKLRGPLERRHA